MKIVNVGLAVVVIAMVAGVLFIEHRSKAVLGEEVARLRLEVEQLAQSRDEGSRVRVKDASPARESETARNEIDRAELARLRDEVAAIKTRTQEVVRQVQAAQAGAGAGKGAESAVPLNLVPVSAWKNGGTATPAAAVETILWAAVGGEVDALASSIALTAGAREKADAMFAPLSEATRIQYGTPEKLMALMVAKDAATVTGMQVLGERAVGPDDAVMRIRLANDQGQTKDEDFPLHRSGTGWRIVMAEKSVEKVARQLGQQPATGK